MPGISLSSLSIVLLFILVIAIAGTWILAAIYVKHYETNSWQYAFAGACGLQGILLLLYCLLNQEIKNFACLSKPKKSRPKDKRNYYSTTDTIQYYGSETTAVDGKTYTVTRPSIKESNTDLRGSSRRLSRLGSTTEVFEDESEYPSPVMDTPAHMESAVKRHIEEQPIPDTPAGGAIQLQSFPFRKGRSSIPSDSVSDRRPDGAEEPELSVTNFCGEGKGSKSNMRKSLDTLSSHSKLQQIPERQPLMSVSDFPKAESPPPYNSGSRHRSHEFKKLTPFEEDHSVDSNSRRKSRRSRRRLEEEFGKTDRESIERRKRSLRYSSGYLSGVTVDQDAQKAEKPHASL